MATDEQIRRRFDELEGRANAMEEIRYRAGTGVNQEVARRWATNALHLVRTVFGEESPHYVNLSTVYNAFRGHASTFHTMRGIFAAAREDYEGGYIFSLRAVVAGEIFGDFVTAARMALADERKDVAAVLACAALEDALKRFAVSHGIDVQDKDMSGVIGMLKAGGHLSGPQKGLVDAMPRIRNAAMHADWAKVTRENVGSVLGFVEQFLLTKFT